MKHYIISWFEFTFISVTKTRISLGLTVDFSPYCSFFITVLCFLYYIYIAFTLHYIYSFGKKLAYKNHM